MGIYIMMKTFRSIHWMIIISIAIRFTSGEGDKEECVESFEELIQVLSNESSYYGMYDYFGHPLYINQLNGTKWNEIFTELEYSTFI